MHLPEDREIYIALLVQCLHSVLSSLGEALPGADWVANHETRPQL